MPSETNGKAGRRGPGRRQGRRREARGGRGAPLSGRSAVGAIACTTVLLAGAVGAGSYAAARGHDVVITAAAGRPAGTASASADAGTSESAAMRMEPRVDWDKVLGDALEKVSGDEHAAWSLALLDTTTGDGAAYGEGAFDTASIVKVDILATLLLQAQDAGRQLTARQKAYAEVMIENSDNTAATALWNEIGRAEGLEAANKRFGLTGTEGGDGLLWGLTQTTAKDQLKLLRTVFDPGDDPVLGAASRAYLTGLMGKVSSAQDWGVPAAAASGTAFEVKNGWLQRSTTGLWDINSIGRVTSGGHSYLVAVLSKGSATQAGGIDLVEDAAQAAVRAFGEAAERDSPEPASASVTAAASQAPASPSSVTS